jgi:hypothetical protein
MNRRGKRKGRTVEKAVELNKKDKSDHRPEAPLMAMSCPVGLRFAFDCGAAMGTPPLE